MQKTAIIVIVLIALVILVIGGYYFLNNKVEDQDYVYEFPEELEAPELENLAPEMDIGSVGENILEDIPETNPLENVPNPFDDDYVNPFEE